MIVPNWLVDMNFWLLIICSGFSMDAFIGKHLGMLWHHPQAGAMWVWDGLGILALNVTTGCSLKCRNSDTPIRMQINSMQFQFFSVQCLKVGQRGRLTCLWLNITQRFVDPWYSPYLDHKHVLRIEDPQEDPVRCWLPNIITLSVCLSVSHSPAFISCLFCDSAVLLFCSCCAPPTSSSSASLTIVIINQSYYKP